MLSPSDGVCGCIGQDDNDDRDDDDDDHHDHDDHDHDVEMITMPGSVRASQSCCCHCQC